MHCSCFSLEYSSAYTNAFSRFSFIFCKYFFGCNPKRGGKLMSPVQLSFKTANGPRGIATINQHIRCYSCSCIRYFSDCPNSEWNDLMPLPWIVNNDVMNHLLKCLIPFFHDSG